MKKKRNPFAKKSFGQNFLTDQNFINKIISALNPQQGENIIEIGAGRGALTGKLVESGANVLAIELERNMIAVLQDEFADDENFQLIEQDALLSNFEKLTEDKGKKTKLVANLPYNISTAILQRLIQQRNCFSEMILMFQLEVVSRITAQVGNSERGFLSVLTEAYLDSEKLFDVPPNAFRPAPKVWSAVVRMLPKKSDIENEDLFREIISIGFAQKRKTILNNLKNSPADLREEFGDFTKLLEFCQIEPQRRAETLTLGEWKKLTKALSSDN